MPVPQNSVSKSSFPSSLILFDLLARIFSMAYQAFPLFKVFFPGFGTKVVIGINFAFNTIGDAVFAV